MSAEVSQAQLQRFEHHDSSAGQEGRDFLRSTVTRCCSSTNSGSLSYINDLLFSSAYTVRLLSFDSFACAAGSPARCYTLVQFDPNYIPSIWSRCFVPHDESTSSQSVRSVSLVLDVSSSYSIYTKFIFCLFIFVFFNKDNILSVFRGVAGSSGAVSTEFIRRSNEGKS